MPYQIDTSREALDAAESWGDRRSRWPRVGRNVLLLGLTSLLTDVSAEMVATILPLYLIYTVGLTPIQFGVVDGVQQGGAAVVRLFGGYLADRLRRYKEVAAIGYAMSAVCKVALLAASSWASLAAIVFVDRAGKGIRTAPRDALISLSVRRRDLGVAFGVHRALDTAGAMIGPLVAFGLLALAPRAFDAIFVVSFCFAVVGLSVLVFFVRNPTAQDGQTLDPPPTITLRDAGGLLGDRSFRTLVVVAGALGLMTLSDGFLYLVLQRQLEFDPQLFPLLYFATALVYMLLAVPVGRIADRHGRQRVFVAGYVILLGVYASLLVPATSDVPRLVLYLVLLGLFYASTEGVLMAVASAALPTELRGSGLALIVSATGLARLVASVTFGAAWTAFGMEVAITCFAVGLLISLPLTAYALARSGRGAVHAS